jgi:hypothetical protein
LAGFWNRNSLLLFGAIGLAVILLLWRLMFGIASVFLNFSEWMADLGFLALASSMVLLGVRLQAAALFRETGRGVLTQVGCQQHMNGEIYAVSSGRSLCEDSIPAQYVGE